LLRRDDARNLGGLSFQALFLLLLFRHACPESGYLEFNRLLLRRRNSVALDRRRQLVQMLGGRAPISCNSRQLLLELSRFPIEDDDALLLLPGSAR
jgi:hypothetical protein